MRKPRKNYTDEKCEETLSMYIREMRNLLEYNSRINVIKGLVKNYTDYVNEEIEARAPDNETAEKYKSMVEQQRKDFMEQFQNADNQAAGYS